MRTFFLASSLGELSNLDWCFQGVGVSRWLFLPWEQREIRYRTFVCQDRQSSTCPVICVHAYFIFLFLSCLFFGRVVQSGPTLSRGRVSNMALSSLRAERNSIQNFCVSRSSTISDVLFRSMMSYIYKIISICPGWCHRTPRGARPDLVRTA